MSRISQSDLCDIEAIRRIKGLYCDTIDRIMREGEPADTDLLRSLFTEDAVIDFTLLDGIVYSGVSQIVDLFTRVLPSGVSWMWHSTGAEIIDIDGDRARGRWTLLAMSQPIGSEGLPPSMTYGRYIDDFVRVDGEWRQNRLFFLNETKPAAT